MMIEQINATTYGFRMPSGDLVEVGDRNSAKFDPYLKLNRWGGECSFSLRFPTTKQIAPILEGERLKWLDDKLEIHYQATGPTGEFEGEKYVGRAELGGIQLIIVLKERPASNELIFNIQAQGLKFNYQPPLTQEEIDDGCSRPECVVGSYAVYHATKRDHILGRTNYMSGKAFHIYRFKAMDASGDKVWTDLDIDEQNGVFTIRLPQDFLNNAVYPVTVGSPDIVTGYFRLYDINEAWETSPANMADGNTDIYASTNNNGEVQKLTSHSIPPPGGITKIEVRVRGYTPTDEKIYLRPVFPAGDGDNHEWSLPALAAWSSWFDITSDTNAPSPWTQQNLTDLDLDIEFVKVGAPGSGYISKVEIRVTYDNATFGFSGTPGSEHFSSDRIRGSIWTGAAGDVTHISVYGTRDLSTNVQGGIYQNADTLLKGKTVTGTLPNVYPNGDWVTMAIDGANPETTVQSYWLMGKVESAVLFYDAGANAYRWKLEAWANPWPANIGLFTASSNRDYGVYATLEEGVGEYSYTGAVLVGALPSATRLSEIARIGLVMTGALPSAVYSKFKQFIASVIIGALASGVRQSQIVRTSSVIVGSLVTAIRQSQIIRTASTLVGALVTAHKRTWLTGWARRVKLTIDQNDIDDALADFPILVRLGTSVGRNNDDASFVFDELENDDNRKKIAVTTSDGQTQCYVEIEKWDDANEQAWLWVKIPAIASGADTELYLYFDKTHADNNTYVGDTNSTPAENVWDSDFKAVSHMRDDPDNEHIRDSTGNNNDGTKLAANKPAVTTDGKIADAQVFEDSTYDEINCGHGASIAQLPAFTWATWVYPTKDGYQGLFYKRYKHWRIRPGGILRAYLENTGLRADCYSSVGIPLNDWSKIEVVYDDNGDRKPYIRINGVDRSTSQVAAGGALYSESAQDLRFGYRGHATLYFLEGRLDETSISSVARPIAWSKASFESERDDLLAFGSEEVDVYKYIALVIVDALASATSIFTRIRRLAVYVITSQYRMLKVITAQNRTLKAITSMYRKIRAITGG